MKLTPIFSILILSTCFSFGCKRLSNTSGVEGFESMASQTSGLDLAIRDSLKQLVGSLTDRKHSIEGGAYVTSVTKASVGNLVSSTNSIIVPIDLNIDVSAKSSRSLPLAADAGGTLNFHGKAQARIKLYVNSSGQADITMAGISWPGGLSSKINVWTNARIARKAVLSKAREQARSMVPSTKAKIRGRVEQLFSSEINQSIAEMRPRFRSFFNNLTDATGLRLKFWGSQGIAHVGALVTGTERKAPAMPSNRELSLSVNETLLGHVGSRFVGGKTQSPDELRLSICNAFKATQMEGCQENKKQKPIRIQMQFPEKSPVAFDLNSDRILLNLTFKIIASTTEDFNLPGLSYWNQNQKEPLALETPDGVSGSKTKVEKKPTEQPALKHITPYINVVVAYSKKTREFVRQSIDIELEKTTDKDGNLFILSQFYRQALVGAIKKQFADIAPEWLGLPAVPLFLLKQGSRETFVIKNERSDFGSRDGWLYTFYDKCHQNTDPFGASLSTHPTESGNKAVKVTRVNSGSPADLAEVVSFEPAKQEGEIVADYKPASGLQANDVIVQFDGSATGIRDVNFFKTLLVSRSTIPSKRDVKLKVARYLTLPGMESKVWIFVDLVVRLNPICGT